MLTHHSRLQQYIRENGFLEVHFEHGKRMPPYMLAGTRGVVEIEKPHGAAGKIAVDDVRNVLPMAQLKEPPRRGVNPGILFVLQAVRLRKVSHEELSRLRGHDAEKNEHNGKRQAKIEKGQGAAPRRNRDRNIPVFSRDKMPRNLTHTLRDVGLPRTGFWILIFHESWGQCMHPTIRLFARIREGSSRTREGG